MTIEEASEKYNIPIEILKEYESWQLCKTAKKVMGNWQYDDEDFERLSLIMTLYDIGFSSEEVKRYMKLKLLEDSTDTQRMKMLNEKRNKVLNEIHLHEKQLEKLDYLRYKIRKQKND